MSEIKESLSGKSKSEFAQLRDATIAAIAVETPGFEVRFKDTDETLAKIDEWVDRLSVFGLVKSLWRRWLVGYTTVLYPHMYYANSKDWEWLPGHALVVAQHEWVHFRDMHTLFGLVKHPGKWVKKCNVFLFKLLYAFPQVLALLSLLAPLSIMMGAPTSHWWLLVFALFALPLPAPFRMFAELRAYRRSVELGRDARSVLKSFTGVGYWYMWPFKKWVLSALQKPSPYAKEMDVLLTREEA